MIPITKLSNKRWLAENTSALGDDYDIAYNKLCLGCQRDCKQSNRVTVLRCPLYTPRGPPLYGE